MRVLIIILSIIFNIKVYSQIILDKPSEELIKRYQNIGDIASILIDTNIQFSNSSKLQIKAKKAKSINLYFNKFKIEHGGNLKVFNSKKELVAEYNQESNSDGGLFVIPPVEGEEVSLELFGYINKSEIEIGQVGYFFKDTEGIESSGFCQVDINCSEGDDWQEEKKGVVRLLLKKSSFTKYCSGSLMNNTSRDCHPYILSAEHCVSGVSESDLEQSIVYFNYENSSCNTSNETSTLSMSGLSKLASSKFEGGSDFLLLELNDEIPTEYNPYFNGWEINEGSFENGVAIHHPKGDFKKVSTYESTLITPNVNELHNPAYWEVTWIETANGHGVTEAGSSGSPIFNQNHLVVGYLSTGLSFCTKPNEPDYFGKLSYAWEEGLDSSKRLDVWLDPLNTNEVKLTGSPYPCNDTSEPNISENFYAKIKLEYFSDKLTLSIFQFEIEKVKIEIIDIKGGIILAKEFYSDIVNQTFDLNKMNQGIYFLKISKINFQRIERFTVIN